jgi:hypothetical protein
MCELIGVINFKIITSTIYGGGGNMNPCLSIPIVSEFTGIKYYKHRLGFFSYTHPGTFSDIITEDRYVMKINHDEKLAANFYFIKDHKIHEHRKTHFGNNLYYDYLKFIGDGDWIEYKLDTLDSNNSCIHEFINVGFTSLKLVCKKCNVEKI